MSDDLDKFVLQYTVDLRDSISRLEKLHSQVDKVSKGSDDLKGKFTGELKGALNDLTQSFGGLEGSLGRVITRMGAVGGAAGVMAAGVAAAVALAAKGIRDINAMQDLSYKTGIGPTSMENLQRNVSKYSNGRVSRDMTKNGMEQWGSFWKDAFANPSGKSALAMGRMGINVRTMGPQAAMAQAAEWMHTHQGADALAIGNQIGWNPNLTNAMAAGGRNIAAMNMTPDQINDHAKAEEAAQRVNKFVGDLNETLSEWKFEAADKVINFFQKAGHFIGGVMETVGQAQIDASNAQLAAMGIDPEKLGKKDAAQTAAEAEAAKKKQQADAEATKKAKEAADKQINAEDQAAIQNAEADAQWKQITEMFGAAVTKFSAAVDPNQALAAWAGEIGRANNLPGSSGSGAPTLTGGGRGNWTANQYGNFIQDAAKKYGVDPQMLYAIMMTESHGKNGQYSETGAGGLMQVTRGNWKAYGNGRDIMDPAANIDVGARIWKESLARAHGDIAQALRYYNGNSDPNYVSKVSSNYGGSIRGIGESKTKIQRREVQQTLAGQLGVPLNQIQLGGVTQGDLAFAAQQSQAGISNNIFQLKKELLNPMLPPTRRAQIQYEIRDQQRGLDLMQQYSSSVVSDQKAGGRVFTEGQLPAINITNVINGTQDPKAVAAEINRTIQKMLNDALINNATGIKG